MSWGFVCEYCLNRCRGELIKKPNSEVEKEADEPVAKKTKSDLCALCLDVLNPKVIDDVIEQAFKLLEDGAYEYTGICFSVTTPVCLLAREAQFKAWHVQQGSSDHAYVCLKDAWKTLLSSRLTLKGRRPKLLRNADDDPTAVTVSVEYTYARDDDECEAVRKLDPACYRKTGKVCGRKYNERTLTRTYVQTILDAAKDADVGKKLGCVPVEAKEGVELSSVEIGRMSFWLAGRYLKFSRNLSQTPWIIDGVRKGETSLEEIIGEGIEEVVACDGVRFSSSGREDVDVRCLGKGRPFLCQIVNPRKLCQDKETAHKIKLRINERAKGEIAVRDVQFVPKSEAGNLKEGEEEKVKCYNALCFSEQPVPGDKLENLADVKELVILQKTPVRVLHRRSLAERPRVIHRMEATRFPGRDERFFQVKMETQAGTYVKEFVHGDLGRTAPSLTSLLGVDVDIFALDVEAVKLDWPPFVDG